MYERFLGPCILYGGRIGQNSHTFCMGSYILYGEMKVELSRIVKVEILQYISPVNA